MAEKVNNQLTTTKEREYKTFSSFVTAPKVQQKLLSSLGDQKQMQKFTASILSSISVNPELQNCDYGSVLAAGLLANSLNLPLSPSLGYAYIVPFDNKSKGIKEATFILGYKGYIQLAIRSGYYKKLTVLPLKEGELKSFDALNEEISAILISDETEREKAKTVGYYAMFEHINGFRKSIYWSKERMLSHADKFSKAFSLNATTGKNAKVSFADFEEGKYPKEDDWKYSSFWYKDFDAMACKTMLRQLLSKWGIMSIDMQKAYDQDSVDIDENENHSDENPIGDFFEINDLNEEENK